MIGEQIEELINGPNRCHMFYEKRVVDIKDGLPKYVKVLDLMLLLKYLLSYAHTYIWEGRSYNMILNPFLSI